MSHPFASVPPRRRSVLLAWLLVAGAALSLTLSVQGRPLATDAAPRGVLSYEFAWTGERADGILQSWSALRETARMQILIDFPYLLVYPLLLSLACAMLAGSSPGAWARAGRALSWAVLASGVLDAVENLALYRMLGHGGSDSLALIAGICASLKFFLVGLAVAYILVQGARVLFGRFRQAAPRTGAAGA